MFITKGVHDHGIYLMCRTIHISTLYKVWNTCSAPIQDTLQNRKSLSYLNIKFINLLVWFCILVLLIQNYSTFWYNQVYSFHYKLDHEVFFLKKNTKLFLISQVWECGYFVLGLHQYKDCTCPNRATHCLWWQIYWN